MWASASKLALTEAAGTDQQPSDSGTQNWFTDRTYHRAGPSYSRAVQVSSAQSAPNNARRLKGHAPPAAPKDNRHLDAFRPIKLQKAADAVIAVLADSIRAGLYEPGDLLPSERSLASRLEVSRNVVRKAIHVLRHEGIVSVKRGPGGGIMVVSDARLREVVAALRGKTHDLMQSALEVRRLLELPAFLLTAARASDAELDALEPLVSGLEPLEDRPEDFYMLDQKFHREVVRLARNPLLADCYRATFAQLAEIRQEFPVLQVPFGQALQNQRTLYAALKSRDRRRIEDAVNDHLTATEIIYLGQPIAWPDVAGYRPTGVSVNRRQATELSNA